MKKLILLYCVFLSSFFSFSQITILSSDLEQPGDVYDIYADTINIPSKGNAGASQTYDFSTVTQSITLKATILTPSATPYGANFPGSTLAITYDNKDFTYHSVTSSLATTDGFAQYIAAAQSFQKVNYIDKLDVGKFPLTFGTNWSDTYKFNFTFKNSSTKNYKVRVTVSGTATSEVDGWGDIITPDGTFECLRMKVTDVYAVKVEVDEPFGWKTHKDKGSNGTSVTYRWLAKETGLPIAELGHNASGVPNRASYTKVKPPVIPVADFTPKDNTLGNYSFTDNSTNSAKSWEWDFGDGDSASTQNPTHVYAGDGNYEVCLIATNAAGSSPKVCKTVTVTGLGPVTPLSSFTHVDNGDGLISFTDKSSKGPTKWIWDFDDNSPVDTTKSPSHTYKGDGDYNVCLIAINVAGSDTSCQTVTITGVTPVPPISGFSYSITGDSATFTNESLNKPTFSFWDFGDNTTDTTKNPTHVYTKDGTYQVCLIVNNEVGADSICETITITGNVQLPEVNFEANIVNITAGESIDFTDLSTNAPDSWNWTFNGANTLNSTDQHPTGIVYPTEGCYEVYLVAGNTAGNGSKYKGCYINVGSLGINSLNNSLDINLFPNPTKGVFSIHGNTINSLINVQIFNIIGKIVKNTTIEKKYDKVIIDISNNPVGMYYVKLNTTFGANTVKIILH